MLYYDVLLEDFDNSINIDATIQTFEECEDNTLSEIVFYHPHNRDDFSNIGNYHAIYSGLLEIENKNNKNKETQRIFISFLKDETQYYVVNVIDSPYGGLFYAAKADNVFDLMQYLYDHNDAWSYVPNLSDYFDPIVASLPQRVEKKYLEANMQNEHDNIQHLKMKI